MAERNLIKDENLDCVVGGYFQFDGDNSTITYSHKDGSVTVHQVLNLMEAWKMSNDLHGQLVPEDEIMARMIQNGYVAG